MFKFVLLSLLLFGSALAVAACGASTAPAEPPPTPTPFVLPPTWTPVVPTNTPTPVTPTPNPVVLALLAALKKANDAPSYRLVLDLTATGDFSTLTRATNPNQPVSLVNLTGEVSSKSDHYILKGLAAQALGGDVNKGIEGLDVGGQSYVHGPVFRLGAMKNQWYILPQDPNATSNTYSVTDLFTAFGGPNSALWQVTPGANAALDGKTCQVEIGDKAAIYNALQIVRGQAPTTRQQVDAIPTAQVKFWICDGYFHQLQLDLAAPDRTHPGQTAGMQMVFHVYDFGATFNFAAPPNPLPVDKTFYKPPANNTPVGSIQLQIVPSATPTFGFKFDMTPFAITPIAFPTFQFP